MKLLLVHRILIASAIGLGIVLCGWAVLRYDRTGETSALVLGGLAAACALALALYWRRIPRPPPDG